MSIATLIERIAGRQRERQEAKLASFRDVVVQIADGKEPDPDFVTEASATPTSLSTICKRPSIYCSNAANCASSGMASRTLRRGRGLERRVADAHRELEAAEQKHYDTVQPLYCELQRLKETEQEGEKAKRELLAICTDQSLLDKLADVQLRLSKKREERDDQRARIANLREWAKSERAAAEQQKMIVDGDGDAQVKVHLARAKEHVRRAAEWESLLVKANKVVAELERDEAAIREQMLMP